MIDVVIPVKDVDRWLDDAIASVLAQIGTSIALTVVDAGSRVPVKLSDDHVRDERVRLIRSETPLFAGAARDLGVAQGSQGLLGFLDADDLWPPDRCRALIDALDVHGAEIAVGRYQEFGERQGPVPGPAHLAGGVLIRRATFERIGGHDSTLGTGEWVDFMARARHQGVREIETEVLALRRRIHGSSTTVANRDLRSEYLRVVRA